MDRQHRDDQDERDRRRASRVRAEPDFAGVSTTNISPMTK